MLHFLKREEDLSSSSTAPTKEPYTPTVMTRIVPPRGRASALIVTTTTEEMPKTSSSSANCCGSVLFTEDKKKWFPVIPVRKFTRISQQSVQREDNTKEDEQVNVSPSQAGAHLQDIPKVEEEESNLIRRTSSSNGLSSTNTSSDVAPDMEKSQDENGEGEKDEELEHVDEATEAERDQFRCLTASNYRPAQHFLSLPTTEIAHRDIAPPLEEQMGISPALALVVRWKKCSKEARHQKQVASSLIFSTFSLSLC